MHFDNAMDTIAKAVSDDFSSLTEVKPPRRHYEASLKLVHFLP